MARFTPSLLPLRRVTFAAPSFFAVLGLLLCPALMFASEPEWTIEPGFTVTQFAGDELAHNIYSMTFNSKGQLTAAGPGYIKTIFDDNHDGVADRSELFSSLPSSGAQGLCFVGSSLYCTGDEGLLLLQDANGDGKADGPPETLLKLGQGEHGAHGIVQGPDGYLYVACGNDAAVTAECISTKYSPVKQPRAGCILRVSLDGKDVQVVADGFRNIYDLAFGPLQLLFTVDSDNERQQYLPWYAECRLFDVMQGGSHGWTDTGWQRSWNWPETWLQSPPQLAKFGRGSPTGMVSYQHDRFPETYRNAIFTLCWTTGRVYCVPWNPEFLEPESRQASLQREITFDGASRPVGESQHVERFFADELSMKERDGFREGHSAEKDLGPFLPHRVFMQAKGSFGFAPVDMEVAPTGALFVASGGRGTQGAIYRIDYAHPREPQVARNERDAIVNAPQPYASWSRALWKPKAMALDRNVWHEALPTHDRAMEIIVELFGAPTLAEVEKASQGKLRENASQRSTATQQTVAYDGEQSRWRPSLPAAASAWALRFCHDKDSAEILEKFNRPLPDMLTTPGEALLVRKASESLGYLGVKPHPDLWAMHSELSASPSRFFANDRWLDPLAARHAWVGNAQWLSTSQQVALQQTAPLSTAGSLPTAAPLPTKNRAPLDDAPRNDATAKPRLKMLGSDFEIGPREGYSPLLFSGYQSLLPLAMWADDRRQLMEQLAALLDAREGPQPHLSRNQAAEVLRLLGAISLDGSSDLGGLVMPKLLERLTNQSDPVDDIHHLLILSLLKCPRDEAITSRTAAALIQLPQKMQAHGYEPSRDWPLAISKLCAELASKDGALGAALVNHAEYGHELHSLYWDSFTSEEKVRAARKLFETWKSEASALAGRRLLEAFTLLPVEEVLPVVRDRWEQLPQTPALAQMLGRSQEKEDKVLFYGLLSSLDPEVLSACYAFLETHSPTALEDEVWANFLRSIRPEFQHDAQFRQQLARLLTVWAPEKAAQLPESFALNDLTKEFIAIRAQKENPPSGLVAAPWQERIASLSEAAGDAKRGGMLFNHYRCAACHAQNTRIGPLLRGAAKKLGPQALFLAVFEPSAQVAAEYRTTRVTTASGQTYLGSLVYESPESTLLSVASGETLRLSGDRIVEMRETSESLMPSGLLDAAGPQDLQDLWAYLRDLQ